MNVGINLLYLLPGVVGGTATYALSLLESIAELDPATRYWVFVNRESRALDLGDRPNVTRVVCAVNARARAARYAYEQFVLRHHVRRHRLDVLHSPGYVGPLFVPCASVLTVPDLNYRSVPEAFTFVRRKVFEYLVPRSARAADAVITISEASRQQIVLGLRLPGEKVTVTPLAAKVRPRSSSAHSALLARRLGIRGRYLLAFSSQSPHKNLERLLRGFREVAATEAVQLVLVGHEPQRGQPLRAVVEELELEDLIVFAGYRSDEDVASLLEHAACFAFPSLYEGFGIPVLEAMEAGVPVVASEAASLPEIVGDAGLLFDPRSEEAIATAIRRVLADPDLRERLIERGRVQAARHSWRQTAELTLAVYRSAHAAKAATHRSGRAGVAVVADR